MVAVYEKQSLTFSHQFHLQTFYYALQDSDYGSVHLVLAAQSSSPENKFNYCFFFFLLSFFSFPLLFAFYFLFCRECQRRSQPVDL